MTTLQFQTAHAQRQVPLLLLHSPAIVGLSAGIGAVFDGHVTWALWGSLWVVGILVSCWAWAMQRRFGLYVGPRSVEVKAVFGGRQHGQMTSAHPPTLSVESRISMQRIVVTDAFGAGAPVAWLVRMTRRDPVRTLASGSPTSYSCGSWTDLIPHRGSGARPASSGPSTTPKRSSGSSRTQWRNGF